MNEAERRANRSGEENNKSSSGLQVSRILKGTAARDSSSGAWHFASQFPSWLRTCELAAEREKREDGKPEENAHLGMLAGSDGWLLFYWRFWQLCKVWGTKINGEMKMIDSALNGFLFLFGNPCDVLLLVFLSQAKGVCTHTSALAEATWCSSCSIRPSIAFRPSLEHPNSITSPCLSSGLSVCGFQRWRRYWYPIRN